MRRSNASKMIAMMMIFIMTFTAVPMTSFAAGNEENAPAVSEQTVEEVAKITEGDAGSGSETPTRGGDTKDVPDDEYRWYDVLTWVPAPDEFFWFGPGRFTPDGKSAVKGVYLDKIKFTLAE